MHMQTTKALICIYIRHVWAVRNYWYKTKAVAKLFKFIDYSESELLADGLNILFCVM